MLQINKVCIVMYFSHITSLLLKWWHHSQECMCHLRNIATKKVRLPDRHTDRQTLDKVIPMCRYVGDTKTAQQYPNWSESAKQYRNTIRSRLLTWFSDSLSCMRCCHDFFMFSISSWLALSSPNYTTLNYVAITNLVFGLPLLHALLPRLLHVFHLLLVSSQFLLQLSFHLFHLWNGQFYWNLYYTNNWLLKVVWRD